MNIKEKNKKIFFGLLPTGKMLQGMQFGAKVDVPAPFSAGQWQFTQTVVPARFRTLAKDNEKEKWSKNGPPTRLDGETYLFSQTYDDFPPKDVDQPFTAPFSTGKSGVALDTPAEILQPVVLTVTVKKEEFRMYVMFKPAGPKSEWVPLQYWGWWWQGTATRAKEKWTLSGNDQGMTIPPGMKKAGPIDAAGVHPEWRRKAQDGEWIADK